jgi:hypothetical protein
MFLGSTQMRTMFPSYDERASQPLTSIDVPSVDVVKFDGGEDQYFPGSWTPVDNRPTKEEALERLEDFNLLVDIVDYLVPEEVSNNIPYWIRGPFGIAPEVAEVLVEIDPLDRIQD